MGSWGIQGPVRVEKPAGVLWRGAPVTWGGALWRVTRNCPCPGATSHIPDVDRTAAPGTAQPRPLPHPPSAELRAGGDQARGAARPPPGTDPLPRWLQRDGYPRPPSVLPGAAGLGSIRGCRVCGGSWSTSASERKSLEGNAAVSMDSCL